MSSIILIHDLSLWSKSSLTVALPTLEAMGHETFSLPTEILSTQSDGFPSLLAHDMESLILPYYEKVKSYLYSFDAVYSGYLGNALIADHVKKILKRENTFSLVDPVLGDNGELYQTMDESNIKAERALIKHSSCITPNLTEASILTDTEIRTSYSNRDIAAIVEKLRKIGPEMGIVTSVPLEIGTLANIAYINDDIRIFSYEDLSVSFPGSGDLFASLFLGLYLNKHPFFVSVKLSGEITTRAIKYSKEIKRERRMGISLASVMSDIRRME